MGSSEQAGAKFNVQFGNVTDSQVVVGDYNTVSQRVGLTPAETAELRAVFTDFKSAVAEGAPAELRTEAVEQAEQLERAVVAEQPDPGAARRVLRWFREHAPQLVGTVVSVVVNPLVGKLVESAGGVIADKFRELVDPENGLGTDELTNRQ